MAILKNLLVNGASRFIGKTYFSDVDISGIASLASLSLSGNLSVTGNTTVGGTLGVTGATTLSTLTATGTVIFNKTTDLSGTANNSPALIVGGTATSAHMELDANEIHAKATGTTVAPLYINNQGGNVYLSGNSVYASGNSFDSDFINVKSNLYAAHYDLQSVAQLGGSFYVSPTLKFPSTASGTKKLKVEKPNATTVKLTITDPSLTSANLAGITWTANSRVKVSGNINGIVTGTMDGKIDSITTNQLIISELTGENAANVVARDSYTGSEYSDLNIMVYQVRVVENNTNYDYRVGIWMNCYDSANQSSTIKVYGGRDSNPNVTIGNLNGMTFNGSTINNTKNWGILTTMGYFEGAIISTEGQIGGFTIGDATLKNGDLGGTTSVVMSIGTSSSTAIGGSSGSKTWAFAASNKFGVTTSGELFATSGKIGGWTIGTSSLYNTTNSMTSTGVGLYLGTDGIRNYASGTQYVNITSGKITALGVDVSGKITATSGAIGGFDITSTAIKTKDVEVTSNADNSISLSSADFTRTINSTSRAGLRFAIGDKFGVTGDGIIYASSVDLTGKITATSGTIGGVTANNSYGLYTNSKTSATSTNTGFLISKDGAIYLGAYNSTNKACPFQVTSAGALTATSGKIGKWNISSNGLYFGGATPDNTSVVLLPGGTNATTNVIGGSSGSNSWIFTIKDLFGVQSSGTLYAQNAHISGTLTAGANSQIGPWNVTTTSIYKGENALGSTTSGAAYFGDLGLSVGNKFKVDASGVATLGESSGYHATMDTDSFDVLNGSTMLATFGETSVIGNMSARGVSINDKGFKFNDGGKTAFYVGVDTRSGSTSQLSTDYYLASNPETITVNEKDYYYVTTVPVDRTVIEVGHSLPLIEDDGDEYLVAADCWWYRDWIINDDKLWIADIEDYEMDESVCYIYTKSSSMSAPYCIIGKNAYSLSNAAGNMSFAQGHECMALGAYSTSVGWKNLSSGTASISSGNQSKAYGNYSFAGGFMSTTQNNNTFAYGYKANACCESSIAFGNQDCEISQIFKIKIVSHDSDTDEITCNITEDADYFEMCLYEASILVTTDNNYIFESIEVTSGSGSSNITFVCYSRNKSIPAINSYLYVRVDPAGSYGEGAMSVNSCCASDRLSTALGLGTVAPAAGLAIGQFNVPQSNVLFSVGNGSAQFNRNNAMTVDMFGNVKATKFQGEQKILWQGKNYMSDSQNANLSELVSAQANGIVLVWSGYTPSTSTAQNYQWHFDFIPKWLVAVHPGAGVTCIMAGATFNPVAAKYVYIDNDKIRGFANNASTSGTSHGISWNNTSFVLRYVIGV